MNQDTAVSKLIENIANECHDSLTIYQLQVMCKHLNYAYAVGFDHCRATTRGGKPVLQKKDGKVIGRFNSALDAAKKMRVTKASISSVARGEKKTCKGYEWEYE